MESRTLDEWLQYLEQGQAGGIIDMSLDRMRIVKERMRLQPSCPVIVVGGTNGKGSTCAFLTQIYKQAGFRVGTLSSPHLIRYNERIAIDGKALDDDTLISALEVIDEIRQDISLTYFEVNVLAAVKIFQDAQVDVMVLEVGLGGRLDAVNVFDADVSVVVNIDLDHQYFLGDNIEDIAFEKAGIFRPEQYAVIGQYPVPQKMLAYIQEIKSIPLIIHENFTFKTMEQQWSYCFQKDINLGSKHCRHALPFPALRGSYQLHNAACALTVIEVLKNQLAVDMGAIKRGLLMVENPGRFQVLPGRPVVVLDVGHNPHAARALKNNLIQLPYAKKKIAVFSMLKDKDIHSVIALLQDCFDEWLIAPLDLPRGMTNKEILSILEQYKITSVRCFENIREAYETALKEVQENDRITVFGSFHTVAAVMDETF